MWQFIAYIGALVKHLWAVLAAIVGSLLVATPSWIRAALSPSWQNWMDSTLTFNVNTVRRAYLFLLPLGLFWATYKAWKEENDGRIAAEKLSPQELQTEVRQLAKQLADTNKELAETKQSQQRTQWHELTEPEKRTFTNVLSGIGPHSFLIEYNANPDCSILGATFNQIFKDAGWRELGATRPTNRAREGLMLITKDDQLLDGDAAMKLLDAFRTVFSDQAIGIGTANKEEGADVVLIIGMRSPRAFGIFG